MISKLFDIPLLGRPVTSYGVCLALAFIFAIYLLPREFRRRNYQESTADWIILAGMVGGILGSKIAHILEFRKEIFEAGIWWNLTHWDAPNPEFMGGSTVVAKFWPRVFEPGGLTFFGGLILATLLIVWVLRRKEVPVREGTDAVMPALAMGYFWGRLGCFFSGDGCYGVAAENTWLPIPLFITWDYKNYLGDGVHLPSGGVVYNTPVMEATVSLGLFFLLMRLRKEMFRPGFLSALFLIVHGGTRFLVEFIRINQPEISFVGWFGIEAQDAAVNLTSDGAQNFAQLQNHHWAGLTMAQLISLALVTWGVVWIIRGKLYTKDPDAYKEQPADEVETASGSAQPA